MSATRTGRSCSSRAPEDEQADEGPWLECERKILSSSTRRVDCGLDEVRHYFDTDTPDGRGFDEVWLADHTLVEPFGGVDLYPLVHATLEGLFDVSSRDKKPYG